MSLIGETKDEDYDPELYDFHQIENADLEKLSIFTSLTGQTYLRGDIS